MHRGKKARTNSIFSVIVTPIIQKMTSIIVAGMIWSNKWGRSDIIDFQPYKAVFDIWETDYTDYDSDIIFFVKRRKREITTVFFIIYLHYTFNV